MGEKITPDTPVIVNSGRNVTPMMSVEKVIGRPTSPAAEYTRSRMVPVPCLPRCRKMFSTMITVESTTMPKSTAPSEIRLAEVPSRDHPAERHQEG